MREHNDLLVKLLFVVAMVLGAALLFILGHQMRPQARGIFFFFVIVITIVAGVGFGVIAAGVNRESEEKEVLEENKALHLL